MMNLLIAIRRRFGNLLHPSRQINRWLLSHWPMIWAERYHVALVATGTLSVAAILLGFTRGATVTYALSKPLDIPLERGLWAAPWCVAGLWFWIRAKGYGSLPIVRIRHGLLYGFFDLLVLFVLVLLPFHYSWSFKLGLQTHLPELEKIAEDEFKLTVAWNEWQSLLVTSFSHNAIDNAVKGLGPERSRFERFTTRTWPELPNSLQGIAKWSVQDPYVSGPNHDGELARIGIKASNLATTEASPSNDPSFVAERAKLEDILLPLSRKYMGIDLSPYLMTGSQGHPDENDIASLLTNVNLQNCNNAFDNFHERLLLFINYSDLGDIVIPMWILFGVLLTTLAIPATTARIYWTAWGALMTVTAAFSYVTYMLSDLLGNQGIEVLLLGVPGLLVAALLLALTSRKIGKHNWIKVVSVFVPLGLICLPLVFDSLNSMLPSNWLVPYFLFVALCADAISRLMFNRLRSLPDPF